MVGAAWFGITGAHAGLTVLFPPLGWVSVVSIGVLRVAVVVLAGFLIANGVTVIKAEGRSLANVLSLLAGISLLALPALAVALLLSGSSAAAGTALVLVVLCSYLGVVFVSFLCYSSVYSRLPQKGQPAAVLILGSRIIDGQVAPLLRSRLDKALRLYRRAKASGAAPLLIPTR